jgi:hypothetical protein
MGGVFNYVNLHSYHYAGNNPVKYIDPTGEFIPTILAGAIVGGVIGGIAGGVSTAITGGKWQDVVSATVTGAASGAALGAIAGTGVGAVGLIVAGGATSAVGSVADQVMSAGLKNGIEGITSLDPGKVATTATISGAIGAVSTGVATLIPKNAISKPIQRLATRGGHD